MKIRSKLVLLFVSIVALISLASSVAIYFFSADHRVDDFYRRLEAKGRITAKLLIEVDEVDEDVLRRIEENNPISLSNEKITIYDFQNHILYTSDDEKELNIDKDFLDEVRLNQEARFRQDQYEGLGILYADKYDRFVVVVAATDIFGHKKLANLRIILIAVFIANVIIILIAGYFYVGRALKPITRVIKEVDDISITSLNSRLNEGRSDDEIGRLARTFNKMLGRLETAFKTQKNFIANASHELRNPITTLAVQVDVALMQERESLSDTEIFSSLREDIQQLKMVSNRLLLLAQANMENTRRRFTVLRIDQLIWEAKSELTRLYPHYKISVTLDVRFDDESKLSVLGDEQLLKSAVINLMDNGCKYSPDSTVAVTIQHHEHRIVLTFQDHGIGIPPEDMPNIFEPFFRGKNVNTVKGTGIGLSLVQGIVKGHFGSIEVVSEGHGTLVTVRFPVA